MVLALKTYKKKLLFFIYFLNVLAVFIVPQEVLGGVLGGPGGVLGRSLGGLGRSLGAKGVSWGAEAGLVGSFGGVLEAPFSFLLGGELHTV